MVAAEVDAVDYMRTASMAVIDYASKYREQLLYNKYQAGRKRDREVVRKEPPFAYVIPQTQRDPGTAVEMLRRLAFNGVPLPVTSWIATRRWME